MTLRTDIDRDVAALFAELKREGLVEAGTLHRAGVLAGGTVDPLTGAKTKPEADQAFDYIEGRQSGLEALGIVLAGASLAQLRHVDFVLWVLQASLGDVVPTLEDEVTARGQRWSLQKLDAAVGVLYRFGLRRQTGTAVP